MNLRDAMAAMCSDPWFQHEEAEAARKLREVEEFLAECERRWPPGEGRSYFISAGGKVSVGSK